MTFYVDNDTNETLSFDVEELLSKLLKETMNVISCPFDDFNVNLTLTDDESIHAVNKEFRGIDRSTDVLSFPAIDFETPGDFSFLTGEEMDYFDPDTKELILGDIMISLEHAHKQAEEYGHSFLREVSFLITHSLLHLSGYDHETDEERLEMEALQTKVLENLNITRD